MKSVAAFLLTVLTCATSLPAGAATAPATAAPSPAESPTPNASPIVELVTGGTPVDVSVTQDLSSRDVSQGTTVPVVVDRNVDMGGMVVIAKGAAGEATLTKVQGAGGNGSGGKIEFVVNWVYSEDGGKVELSDNANDSANADRKGEASTLAIAGYLTLGLAGLFSHNLAHGKDAVISKDKIFHVFVDHDVHITTSQTDDTQAGFDH
jgi:hypothetical protein